MEQLKYRYGHHITEHSNKITSEKTIENRNIINIVQAYHDITTGQMTLRFEIFCRETANWQEENMQVWSG